MDFSYLDLWKEESSPEEHGEAAEGDRNVWVFAETVNGALHPAMLEGLGQARMLADTIGVYVYAILLGARAGTLADILIAGGADRVLVADDPRCPDRLSTYQPEIFTRALADLVKQYRPEILLLAATDLGNDLAPRLAQHLDTGLISHCVKVEIDMAERLLVGTCPALGGEVYHTFTCPRARPQMATIEPGYYHSPGQEASRAGELQQVELDLENITGRLAWDASSPSSETIQNLPPVGLSQARVVVAGGRGLKNLQGFSLVQELAASLSGVVAGSRGAFDEGWIGEDQIVGVSNEPIAPDLYIACGLSGDVFHYFNAQDARFIVAINTDENAPIMKVANLALVTDAHKLIPLILKALKTDEAVVEV